MKNTAKKLARLFSIGAILLFTAIMAFANAPVASGQEVQNGNTAKPAGPQTVIINSLPADDGWILETTESSNRGGKINNKTMLIVGDDAANRQYQSILSFNTAVIPTNANITSVTLKIKKISITGVDPVSTHGKLVADLKKGYFGSSQTLQPTDFNASATLAKAIVINKVPSAGWQSGSLNTSNLGLINKSGVTQFLLHFTKDDDNDKKADYVTFASGDAAQTSRPQLLITYTFPDTTSPAKIDTLSAQTGNIGGSVDLTWTAPGDDGTTGAATAYLIRYSATTITTESDWENATVYQHDVQVPSLAGTQEKLTVRGLTPEQTYYFAVRALDEASNLGGLSNIPSAQAKIEDHATIQTSGGELKAAGGEVGIDFPAGAVAEPVNIHYEDNIPMADAMSPSPATVFNLTAETKNGTAISQFQKEITIQVNVPKNNSDEHLALYYFDTTNKKWVKLPSTYDKATSTLIGTTTHFTTYAALNPYTPYITALSPNPGSGYVGDTVNAQFNVQMEVDPGSVLSVHIGPTTDSFFSQGFAYKCYNFPAGMSLSTNITFTIPSPGAPSSVPYKVWAYYRPSLGAGSNCPTFLQSLPGETYNSLSYSVEWAPKAPPQISNVQIVNIHSTSALVKWQTDVPADDVVLDILGNVRADDWNPNPLTKPTNHEIGILNFLPGDHFYGKVKSCNNFGCTLQNIDFSTVSGCTGVTLTYPNALQPVSGAINNKWVFSGQPEMGGVAPNNYGVYVRVWVDNASPFTKDSQWVNHYDVSNIGDLDAHIWISGFDNGGLQKQVFSLGEAWRWKYQTEETITIPKSGEQTNLYYALPIFIPGSDLLAVEEFPINAEIITSGRGKYNGPCPQTATPGKAVVNYHAVPISEGKFTPTSDTYIDANGQAREKPGTDLFLWDEIKKEAAMREWWNQRAVDALVFVVGEGLGQEELQFIGKKAVEKIISVGSILFPAIKEYGDIQNTNVWGLDSYNPADEVTYWKVYSVAGVKLDGTSSGTRQYYVMYARYAVTNETPLTADLRVWAGYRDGYPEWLISSTAKAYFNDCETIGGQTVNAQACMSAESYSPVSIALAGAGGQFFDKDHKAGSVYEAILEDKQSGKFGEHISVPNGDYQVIVTGLNDDTFSLMLTRPFDERTQGIFYQNVPIKIGEKIQVNLPQNGYIDPIVLPDGTKIFPLDVRAPETTISAIPNLPDGKNGWYVHDIGINVSAVDDLTGIENIQCRVNGGPWSFYVNQFFVTTEKVDNLIECFATDKYGNIENIKSITLKLDKTAPISTNQLTGTSGNHNWFKSDVTVNLSATDNVSGVDYIEYNLDGAGWTHYSTPFTISVEGIHNVQYRASDIAGNLETAQSQEIKIDKTAPSLTASVDKTVYVRLEYLTLHYEASDAVSGIDFVSTDLAGDPLQNDVPYEVLWLPVGKHTITVIAQDMAGWTTQQQIEIEVIATLDSLHALVLRLVELGEINEHTDTSLLAHIDGAADSYQRGQINVAINKLEALIHEVDGQTSQHISDRANQLLIGDAKYVEEHLK